MGDKKTESREVPIRFVSDSEEAETGRDGSANADLDDNATPEVEDAIDPEESGSEAAGLVQTDWQAQIEALTQERTTLYDQLLRRQAEFENFRRRTERERAEVNHRARADVMVEMLPVLDNLERALISADEDISEEGNALRHGVELIYKQFKDALAKLGLQPLNTVGEKFDPNLHEAVASEQSDEHKENTVIEEFQRGYKLGDRLLRPAKVKVAASAKD